MKTPTPIPNQGDCHQKPKKTSNFVEKKRANTVISIEENRQEVELIDLPPHLDTHSWKMKTCTVIIAKELSFGEKRSDQVSASEKGYFQFPFDPRDKEKDHIYLSLRNVWPTVACHFGYAMTPRARSKGYVAIFYDMVEKTMEVFMGDLLGLWEFHFIKIALRL
ncbi:hypothetical protein Tco_0493985 [Tanacetum coccineum]